LQLGCAYGADPLCLGRRTQYDQVSVAAEARSQSLADGPRGIIEPSGTDQAIADSRLPAVVPTHEGFHAYAKSADPLYLFCCGLLWQHGNASAGWELIQGLKSSNADERVLASALLGGTEEMRQLLRGNPAGRQAGQTGPPISKDCAGDASRNMDRKVAMNTPYGLEIVDSCVQCKLRQEHWFCNLSPVVLKAFSDVSHHSTYPGGALLFLEGQMPRGAYVLCCGRVKLSTMSREGKVLILKIAEAGEVLGLSAVISGTAYEVSAETAGPCQVNFVDRESLLKLVNKSGELALHSAQALSREFQSAYRDIHDLVLARSSEGKLAKLLLSWTPGGDNPANEVRVRSCLTHEEMAQMIGASRETVTRLLSSLKKKNLITLEGSMLVIHNRIALEALAA